MPRVELKMLCKGIDLLGFLKVPKNMQFLNIFFAFYKIMAVTNLRVVKSGSPQLHITKSGWQRQKSQPDKV